MQFNLIPHPASPPTNPELKVWASVDHAASLGATATTNIWFGVGAPTGRFLLPPPSEGLRTDGLWQTTCFEAFLRAADETAYREWNFAPSGDWAAYDFTAPRQNMVEAEIGAPPYIRMEDNLTWWALGATIAIEADRKWDLGLSVILEETDGTKSYWALAHPSLETADFHHPDCFIARLA